MDGLTLRMSSRVYSSGDSPPCMQENCLSMIAISGREAATDELNTHLVDAHGEIVHRFEPEREVVNQMPALMVPMKEGGRV